MQPRKVSAAEAETRRQEGQCQARQQEAETLKWSRDERGDEFLHASAPQPGEGGVYEVKLVLV